MSDLALIGLLNHPWLLRDSGKPPTVRVEMTVDQLTRAIDDNFDAMVDFRRALHAVPELGFEETRTTAAIRERLGSLGLIERTAGTPTGAVFTLQGGRPGRPVVIRADIDALPVTERVDLTFASTVEGRMHACGHDAHTAVLVGVARALATMTEELAGSYIFVFQPAEELLNGARRMVEGGVLDGLRDAVVIGHHVTSILPTGVVGTRSGIAMAEAHDIQLVARGPGGHGGVADTPGDVVRAIANAVTELCTIVDGLSFEHVPCVCSAGMVHAGAATNVIPNEAMLRGTLRTFTSSQRQQALGRLGDLCDRIAADHGVVVELDLPGNAPAVNNDPVVTEVVTRTARELLGDQQVHTMPPVTPSDDMSIFLDRLPGCYFFVGGAKADGTSGMHHSPTFSIDEESMRVAARITAHAARALAWADPQSPDS